MYLQDGNILCFFDGNAPVGGPANSDYLVVAEAVDLIMARWRWWF